MPPEQRTREKIDRQLTGLGGMIQDLDKLRRRAGLGVAVREVKTASGPVDYALYIGGRAAGVVEAKRTDEDPESINDQTDRYIEGFAFDTIFGQNLLHYINESNKQT